MALIAITVLSLTESHGTVATITIKSASITRHAPRWVPYEVRQKLRGEYLLGR